MAQRSASSGAHRRQAARAIGPSAATVLHAHALLQLAAEVFGAHAALAAPPTRLLYSCGTIG